MADHRDDHTRAVGRLDSHERTAIVVAAAATAVLTLVTTVQAYVGRRAAAEPIMMWQSALISAVTWAIWAVFAPGILWLGRHADFRRGRRFVSAVAHVAACLACQLGSAWIVMKLGMALFAPNETVPTGEWLRLTLMSSRLPLTAVLYASILGLGYAVRLHRRLREREMQAVRLEALATHARLEALAARLQPHFLFNTLHAIGVLTEENPREARAMLTELGDLLREVLTDAGGTDIKLRDELALLDRYIRIEQRRFADRLSVTVRAAPEVLDVHVPRLLLQPLAENAIKHGLATRSAGRVTIDVAPEGDWLVVRIWNDGAPLPAGRKEGVGLTTTRERLRTRYRSAEFDLRDANGGVEAVVRVPLAAEVAG